MAISPKKAHETSQLGCMGTNDTLNTSPKQSHMKNPSIQQNKLTKQYSEKTLPVVLLANVQSFGNTLKTDKTTELEAVLQLNEVKIGIFTETWLTDTTSEQLKMDNYLMFHSVRSKVKRPSGGVSVFVKDNIPAKKIDINIPEHLEVM